MRALWLLQLPPQSLLIAPATSSTIASPNFGVVLLQIKGHFEVGVLVVKEALSKGDGECDKRKRKECVSSGTKKKEQLMSCLLYTSAIVEEVEGGISS
ncbi:hypothetical protein DEO72_LG10g1419 [Vigna unguiculata]|uniref:Secreted protein n=1 Tax=Vigna unguiculata TaxID=3917 RepID=A0A4D6N8N7_VIGUN|nr:hypothetical protein DEO72_LG10g1419 [Vigna unguiculata]